MERQAEERRQSAPPGDVQKVNTAKPFELGFRLAHDCAIMRAELAVGKIGSLKLGIGMPKPGSGGCVCLDAYQDDEETVLGQNGRIMASLSECVAPEHDHGSNDWLLRHTL